MVVPPQTLGPPGAEARAAPGVLLLSGCLLGPWGRPVGVEGAQASCVAGPSVMHFPCPGWMCHGLVPAPGRVEDPPDELQGRISGEWGPHTRALSLLLPGSVAGEPMCEPWEAARVQSPAQHGLGPIVPVAGSVSSGLPRPNPYLARPPGACGPACCWAQLQGLVCSVSAQPGRP